LKGHIICHTHWDREWFASYDVTNDWLCKFFENLLDLFEKENEPNFKFVLDGQTLILEDFLKTCKNKKLKNKITNLIDSKKILVGPLYAQIDFRISGESSILNNILLGLENLNVSTQDAVAWMVDNFGFIGQIPQILKIFGINKSVIWRGVNSETNLEKTWVGSDGTTLKTIWLISGYRNFYNIFSTRDIADKRCMNEIKKLKSFSYSKNIPLLDGYDLDVKPENPKRFIKSCNAFLSEPKKLFNDNFFFKKQNIYGEQISGKYACTFPGTLSTRVQLKLQAYFTEKFLNLLEFLNIISESNVKTKNLWKKYIKNLIHDNICGVGIDYIHESMEKQFYNISRKSKSLIINSLNKLAAKLGLPSGEYILNLSNYKYNVWYSNDKYCYLLNSDGISINKVKAYKITKTEKIKDENIYWENNYYKAKMDQKNGTFQIRYKDINSKKEVTIGKYFLYDELGDTYSTFRKNSNYSINIRNIKIKYKNEHNLVISFKRKIYNDQVSIETKETIIFDQTPIIKWKIKTIQKGKNYVLTFLSFGDKFNNHFARMPFEIVERKNIDNDYFSDKVPKELSEILLAARETNQNSIFPFQGFVGYKDTTHIFSTFTKGLREYRIFKNQGIEITLLRSIEWIAKENVPGRSGDAGPLIYTPKASLENKSFEFELGFYFNSNNSLEELYKWFMLFDNPPILFNVKSNSSSDLNQIQLAEIKYPWVILSNKKIAIYNPFNFSYNGLKPLKIKIVPPKDIAFKFPSVENNSNSNNIKVEIFDFPSFPFSKKKNNNIDRNKLKEIKDAMKIIKTQIDNIKLKIRESKTKCEEIKLKHNLYSLERKYMELKISLLLLKKKPYEIKNIFWKYNQIRAKRRTYDYLVQMCNAENESI